MEIMKGMWTENELASVTPREESKEQIVEESVKASPDPTASDMLMSHAPAGLKKSQNLFTNASELAGPSVPPGPARVFRGIAVPAVALEEVRENTAAEVEAFRNSLKASDALFDKCLSVKQERRHSGTASATLVQPYWDQERHQGVVLERETLKLPDFPSRQRGFVSDGDAACEGCVPPPASPPNQLKEGEGMPEPPHLQGLLSVYRFGSRGERRPRSAERESEPFARRSLYMQVAPRVHSADGRVRKASADLIEETADVGAKMAADKLKHFLSRKCGRIETAFEQLDRCGNGFITIQDWMDGLARLEYDHLEYAHEIFKLLDTRQHHVLTVSDLRGRVNSHVYEGIPDPKPDTHIEEEMLQLISEVLGDEVNTIIRESMCQLAYSSLRCPHAPLAECPDVAAWLKSSRKAKPKIDGQNQRPVSVQQESESDREAQILEMMSNDIPGQAVEKDKASLTGRRSKRLKSLVDKQQVAGTKMPKLGGEVSDNGSESDRSSRAPSRGAGSSRQESRSPSTKTSMGKKIAGEPKSPKGSRWGTAKRKAGVMAMMVGELLKKDDGAVADAPEASEQESEPVTKQDNAKKPHTEDGRSERRRKSHRSKRNAKRRSESERCSSAQEDERLEKKHLENGNLQEERSRGNDSSHQKDHPVGQQASSRQDLRTENDGFAPPDGIGPAKEGGFSEEERPVSAKGEHGDDMDLVISNDERPVVERRQTSNRHSGSPVKSRSRPPQKQTFSQRVQEGIILSDRAATAPSTFSDPLRFKELGRRAAKSDDCSAANGLQSADVIDAASPGKESEASRLEGLGPQRLSSVPIASKGRQLRVVQLARGGPSGYVSVPSNRMEWLQSGGSKPSSAFADVGMQQQEASMYDSSDSKGFRSSPEKLRTGTGQNFFDADSHEPPHTAPRSADRLLPYIPQGIESVCKTYSHIHKLLNDPHLKKRMPSRQKVDVHVSMPRLPSASVTVSTMGSESEYPSAIAEDTGVFKMFGSKSAPSIISTPNSTASSFNGSRKPNAWLSKSTGADEKGVTGRDHVQLPAFARSR